MKVLVADTFEQSGLEGLKAAGAEVVYQPGLKGSELADALKGSDAHVLVVRSTEVTAAMFEGGGLSLVVRAGAGYNTIDVAAASRHGVYVSNCPGKNAVAVAELAFGLILAIDRRIPDGVSALRAGEWNKKAFAKARGLYGRTLGLLGFGHIGKEMATRASAFGMRTVVWSRSLADGVHSAPQPSVVVAASPEKVAEQSDVLSVHLALTPETRGLVGRSVFERLKPGAYFINTARAEIVDYAALEQAIRDRGVRAGLDVFPHEPTTAAGPFSDPVGALKEVYGTHHIGASTEQAQEAIAAEVVRIVATYQSTGKVENVVNLAKRTAATDALIVRHRDRPGVLAHVFDALRSARINVQETENVVFEGAEAAVARINLDGAPSAALLKQIRETNNDILDLYVVKI